MGTGSKSARNSWAGTPDCVARWAALKEPNPKSHLFLCTEPLAALSTSMFRFPAPGQVDPRVEGLLAFERGWLTGGWAMEKVVSTLAVAPVLGVLCLASWRRSLLWGLVIANAMAVWKMAWWVVDGAGTGWAMPEPALAGLVVCDVVVLYAVHRMFSRSEVEDT